MSAKRIIKKSVISVIVLLLCVVMSSCSLGQIEDTNGSDTSLCSITEEKIFSKSTSYISYGSLLTQKNNELQFQVKKLSGVYTLQKISAQGTRLNIRVSTNLEEGNLRIVLMGNGKYISDISLGTNQYVTVDNPDGKYEVRLAAESAKINISLSYTVEK